jgi:hypothetical protein
VTRSRKPAPAPHAPTGDFAPPRTPQGLVCDCGAALTRVPNGATDPARLDWTVVDAQDRQWVDVTPTYRYRMNDGSTVEIDMHDADAWDRLADMDIGKYSILRCAIGLNGGLFTHVHREATPREDLGLSLQELRARSQDPPECHGRPMWAAPDGWRCREAMTTPALVPYSSDWTAPTIPVDEDAPMLP